MTGKEVHNKKTYRIVAWLSILALLPLLSSCHKDSGEGKKAVETSEKKSNYDRRLHLGRLYRSQF